MFGASVDRRWLQFTLGDHAYFWSTRRSGELDLKNADRVARSVGAFAEAVAISNSGTRAVVSNAGQMYSSSAVPPTGETSSVLEREALTGNARVTDRGLSFAGGNNTLVAAVGDNLALWKLDQAGRTDTPASVDISYGCSGCVNSPAVSLPPDGKAVTIDAVGHKTSVSDLITGKP